MNSFIPRENATLWLHIIGTALEFLKFSLMTQSWMSWTMPANIGTPLELFLLAVSLGLFVMAVLTITRRRQAPQSRLLALAMCAEAFYCLGYAQEMSQTTLAGAIFWLRVEYIGIPWIPALWVLIGRRHFGLRGRAVLLSIIPVIVALAEWTNGMHGLYDRSMMLVPLSGWSRSTEAPLSG